MSFYFPIIKNEFRKMQWIKVVCIRYIYINFTDTRVKFTVQWHGYIYRWAYGISERVTRVMQPCNIYDQDFFFIIKKNKLIKN